MSSSPTTEPGPSRAGHRVGSCCDVADAPQTAAAIYVPARMRPSAVPRTDDQRARSPRPSSRSGSPTRRPPMKSPMRWWVTRQATARWPTSGRKAPAIATSGSAPCCWWRSRTTSHWSQERSGPITHLVRISGQDYGRINGVVRISTLENPALAKIDLHGHYPGFVAVRRAPIGRADDYAMRRAGG